MICQLRGILLETSLEKDTLKVVVDLQGVGYEVLLPKSSDGKLPLKRVVTLFVCESVTAYDGATTLYGFVSREEKEFYMQIRENVGGMGPKKALECIDKIAKSLPDFKRAIIDGDLRLLVSVFGFTKKTAEKLVFSLKGKVQGWSVTGTAKWAGVTQSSEESDALSGLLNLGYREDEARDIMGRAKAKLGPQANTQSLIQEALRFVGARIS